MFQLKLITQVNMMKIKKQIGAIIIAATTLTTSAQLGTCDFTENYNSSVGWTSINNFTPNPNGSNQLQSNPIVIQGGVVDFNNARCGWNDVRVYRPLGRELCNSWVAEFTFDPQMTPSGGNSHGAAIFCLTAGTQTPTRDVFDNWSDQDGINVVFSDGAGTDDGRFRIEIKDGPVNTSLGTTSIPGVLNGVFDIRLERINTTKGRFTVTDRTNPDISTTICFDFPESITGLTHLQHANYASAYEARQTDAVIDDVCIFDCQRVAPCCFNADIMGPSQICTSGEIPGTFQYMVENDPAATYTWSVSNGSILSGQNTNEIDVQFLPTLGTVQATVQVIIECNCFTDTLTKTVTITDHSGADANFSRSMPDNGSIYTSVTLIATSTDPNFTHTWAIYQGANCNDPNHPIANPTPLATGTGSTWSQSLLSLGIPISQCLVLEHVMTEEGSACPSIVDRRHMSRTDSESRYIPKNNNTKPATSKSGVEVYPSPTSGSLNVNVTTNKKITSLSIVDVNGKIVYNQSEGLESKNTLSLEHLASGTYIISLRYSDDSTESISFNKK